MTKPWEALTEASVARLGGQLGVYEIGSANGGILYIGFAGGRSRFGLRGELGRELKVRRAGAALFRVETTMAYLTRWRELLMVHRADHGGLPAGNEGSDDVARLGRLSPT